MTDSNEHPTGYVDLTGAAQPTAGAQATPTDATVAPQIPTSAPVPPTDYVEEADQTAATNVTAPPAPLKSPFPLPNLRDTLDSEPGDDERNRAEFTTVYDVIDKLTAALEEAKGSFFTPSQVKVDRDQIEGYLDDLKKMLPVQLERASALMREAERRLESAQTQANAIVASAQSRAADTVKEANEQAQFLAGQENVTELARKKAGEILSAAQAKADHLTRGADEYSTKVMETLKTQLTKMGNDVDAGLNVLYERQKSAAAAMPTLNDNTTEAN